MLAGATSLKTSVLYTYSTPNSQLSTPRGWNHCSHDQNNGSNIEPPPKKPGAQGCRWDIQALTVVGKKLTMNWKILGLHIQIKTCIWLLERLLDLTIATQNVDPWSNALKFPSIHTLTHLCWFLTNLHGLASCFGDSSSMLSCPHPNNPTLKIRGPPRCTYSDLSTTQEQIHPLWERWH